MVLSLGEDADEAMRWGELEQLAEDEVGKARQ